MIGSVFISESLWSGWLAWCPPSPQKNEHQKRVFWRILKTVENTDEDIGISICVEIGGTASHPKSPGPHSTIAKRLWAGIKPGPMTLSRRGVRHVRVVSETASQRRWMGGDVVSGAWMNGDGKTFKDKKTTLACRWFIFCGPQGGILFGNYPFAFISSV